MAVDEDTIRNRIAELIQERAKLVENILRNTPAIALYDGAIAELKALIENPPPQDKPVEQQASVVSTGNE